MNETRSDGGIENVEHDRISSLPDEVLTHILSFLSTKEAVQTCVLSKRWINTWATVPVLNFNLYEFMSDGLKGEPGRETEKRESVARFEQFVHGVLNNIHESTNLDIVRYIREIQSSETFIPMEWLDRVALLMPRVIHIFISRVDFKRGNGVDLPDSVFSNARLQRLKMVLVRRGRTPTIIRPASIILPSLKVLELSYVGLPNDFTQKLFMGCPSLERLDLRCCELYFSSISSNVLKKLTILQFCQFDHMQISCPGLVSLFIDSDFQKGGVGISLKKAISLVNATIRLVWWRHVGGHDVPVLDLFSSLSSSAELSLYFASDLKESVEKDVSNCRNFKNLKKLHIEMRDMRSYIEMRDTRCDFYLMACLLKCSPNLNELNLLVILRGDKIQEEPRREILGDAFFRHEYLETVNISVTGMSKLPSECVETLIRTLDKYIKKIGNIIITYDS